MLESVFRSPRVVALIRDNCLADSFTDLVVYLRGRGHPVSTIQMYVQVSEHVGQWLKTEGIRSSRVNSRTVERFLKQHYPKCRCLPPSSCYINNVRAGLRHLLVVLQKRYQHLPQPHKEILPSRDCSAGLPDSYGRDLRFAFHHLFQSKTLHSRVYDVCLWCPYPEREKNPARRSRQILRGTGQVIQPG